MGKIIAICFLFTLSLNAQTFNVWNVDQFRDALQGAALNDESDTIIMHKGTYKTTTDGGGPFEFIDQQNYDLTIQAANGLSASDVILDGDHTDTVLTFKNDDEDTKISIKNISVTKGYERGIYSEEFLDLYRCKISFNGELKENEDGGGVYAYSGLKMSGCEVNGNMGYDGAGVYAKGDYNAQERDIKIEYSNIHHNSSKNNGGGIYIYGYYNNVEIRNSNIEQNIADGGYGGGIYVYGYSSYYSDYYPLIEKCKFSGNATNNYYHRGSAIYANSELTLLNNLIVKNDKGIAVYLYDFSYVINNTFADNNLGQTTEYVLRGEGKIINNIFTHNNGGIYISDDTYFYNNYYDPSMFDVYQYATVYKKNNNKPSDGSIDFSPSYYLKSQSTVAINTGLNPNSDEFRKIIEIGYYRYLQDHLKTDYSRGPRIVGSNIDMGAYENTPPHADAGSDKRVQVNHSVRITGKETGNIVSRKWKEAGYTLATTSSFVYTPDTLGEHILTFTVTDSEGNTNTDSMKVIVTEFPPFNIAPILLLLL